jgi:hypothetical protein
MGGAVTRWPSLPGERRSLYGAIGLRLVDDLTGGPPMGSVRVELDLRDGATWNAVDRRVLVTPGGMVTCPGLERRADPAGAGPRRYRLRLEADLYRPLYRESDDGVEFDAHPYNDETPPRSFSRSARDARLAPARGYPFPAHVRVLRGEVVDAVGDPVEDAVVSEGASDRALTDERGLFALALRTAAEGVPVQITADHQRSNTSGSVTVTLPDDLGRNQTIQVT